MIFRRLVKIFASLLLVAVLLAVGTGGYFYFNYPLQFRPQDIPEFQPQPSKAPDTVLSAEEVAQDIAQLISVLEESHPYFLQGQTIPDSYYPAKEKLLGYRGSSLTVQQLELQVAEFLASLHDGHTQVLFGSGSESALDVDWNYIDGKLYLLDEALSPKGEVVRIGGVATGQIVEQILRIFPTENAYGVANRVESYAKEKFVLQLVGVEDSSAVEIEYIQDGQHKTMPCYYLPHKNQENSYTEAIAEDMLYIRLTEFEHTVFFERILADITAAEQQGVDRYIIDLRGNPGGSSKATEQLFEALQLKNISQAPLLTRFSPLSCEQLGYIQKSGSVFVKGKHSTVQDLTNEIYVLVDEASFSASVLTAACLQDSDAATIIGRPSGNNTSFPMNAVETQLEHSKIHLEIATSFRGRANQSTPDDLLHPDIYVEKNDDILQVALDYIAQK